MIQHLDQEMCEKLMFVGCLLTTVCEKKCFSTREDSFKTLSFPDLFLFVLLLLFLNFLEENVETD